MKNDSELILLSVIVPIGDMAGRLDFLETWLKKITNQPLEVILVHDKTFLSVGSELKKLFESLNSSKIILTQGLFGNPGTARNAGLEFANGPWIGFWDSDDFPNVENILAAINSSHENDEILVGDFSIFDINSMEHKNFSMGLNGINAVAINPGVWRMVFRRQTIGETRFPSLKMGEDQVFLSLLNFGIRSLRFVDSFFYQYNIGGASQLTKSRIALKDLPQASEIILVHAKKSTRNQTIFDMQLFFRQQITVLKNGDFKLRISTCKFIGAYSKGISFNFLVGSVIALYRVLRVIRSSGIK
jgi:glycosyltransferase involved in cell wall biosynthesis